MAVPKHPVPVCGCDTKMHGAVNEDHHRLVTTLPSCVHSSIEAISRIVNDQVLLILLTDITMKTKKTYVLPPS